MTSLAVISDLHYFSPALSDNGYAYRLRSLSDQKCLLESGGIIRGALREIKAERPDALLIAGDITNDGEQVCHEEILALLKAFDKNIPVFAVTSTHDWCSDGKARRYEGKHIYTDVPFFGKTQLKDAYMRFGEKQELARFETSLGFYSRVFQIGEKEVLIAVNDDGDGKNGAAGYSEGHLNWMCEQIKKARDNGCAVVAMEHHLLIDSVHRLINKTQRIANGDEAAQRLADAGLRLMIVGHSHMQRTSVYTSEKGNRLTQINMGALTGYPAPILYMKIDGKTAEIHVESLTEFEYNGEKKTLSYIKDHTSGVLLCVLNAAKKSKTEFFDLLQANGIRIRGLSALYPLIRTLAKKSQTVTVGRTGRLINVLTLGKGIDKTALQALRDEPLLPYLIKYFLCVFDGGKGVGEAAPSEKRVLSDLSVLPVKIAAGLPLKADKKESLRHKAVELETLIGALAEPNVHDNYECEIELC